MCAIDIEPVIETRRLRLRKPRRADAPRIAELANDFDVARMTCNLPHPYGREDALAYLAHVDSREPDSHAAFVIEHPAEGPLGVLGFDARGPGRTELGYWLGKPYWGRGFATEAARAALVWVNRAWNRRAVTAQHFADNPASGEVLTKLGFLYTGDRGLAPCRARGESVPARMMVWLA